ncbi:hypothetical protein [Singulisphaera sp. PoT]|uniref:hypothetical protein n=1 Tax=Singulisphaera sp. PoT TaxID=3411797 RepID=UPI003BF60DEC
MRLAFVRLGLIVLTALAGCGNPPPPMSTLETGRKALEDGLAAWKDGKTAASMGDAKPAVDFVDYQWRAGKKLSSYTIVSDAKGESNHTYTVDLTLANTDEAKQVEYMVFGSDPIHVFRDEDYARTLNMDNAPTVPKSAKKRR